MFEKISGTMKIIEKALDASWLRNEAISQNIANVDTPNYKRKTVLFEEYLNRAMDKSRVNGQKTHASHLSVGGSAVDKVNPVVIYDHKALSYRLDGNNVDIESESASMAKNTIKYNVLVQSLNAGFNRLRSVISEGRR